MKKLIISIIKKIKSLFEKKKEEEKNKDNNYPLY